MAATKKPVTEKATAAVKVEETKAATKTAAVKAEPVKATVEKVEEKKEEPAKKAPAKKEPAKKEPVKKAATKKAEVKTAMQIQFNGKSYTEEDLMKIAKDVWKYDLKQNDEDLVSVELYVKPEENKVYYVMNDIAGSFDI
uniref:DUF6465 family protein n=1 Tax=Acetatifactor sp. TaxID=1872090 RepID=UPI004055F1C5